MLFIRIDDVRFLVDDRVKWIATMKLGSCAVVRKVFGGLFNVEDAILAVDFAIEDTINDRSIDHAFWFAYGNRREKTISESISRD